MFVFVQAKEVAAAEVAKAATVATIGKIVMAAEVEDDTEIVAAAMAVATTMDLIGITVRGICPHQPPGRPP